MKNLLSVTAIQLGIGQDDHPNDAKLNSHYREGASYRAQGHSLEYLLDSLDARLADILGFPSGAFRHSLAFVLCGR